MSAVAMPLSPAQVAEACGVSLYAVYRAIKAGTLRARHKVGETQRWWILEEDMRAWAAGGMFGEEATCQRQ